MRTRWRALGTLVLSGGLVFGSALTAQALTPNQSIFLYKPGKAVTGTLKDGVFTKKRTLELRGWELAAASRDTLALYDRDTGKLRTGKFRRGVFMPFETKTLSTGFRIMVASCDTLLLYEPASGRALTGVLVEGKLRHRTTVQLATIWDQIAASCDTIVFEDGDTSVWNWGALTSGLFAQTGGTSNLGRARIVAATADSYMAYDTNTCSNVPPHCAHWGHLEGGVLSLAGDASNAGVFDRIGGTASSLLLYDTDGTAARATLKAGAFVPMGPPGPFAKGWKVISGGR
jgi:hypothetical protein